MIPKDGINLQYLKEALRRRFWYIVLPFFAVSIGTVGHCIKAPRIYRSSTLILVQPQEIPSDYVRPTVTSDARSRLNTLREQVMSRPRLEEIIKEYDLYQKLRANLTMYDAVETMRKHITVTVKEVQRRGDTAPAAFEVSYDGRDPAKVRDVTAAIARLFIDDNLKLRETQAAGTSKFLERELERMKEELRQREELVRQFKEKHMGQLPEQMENNYRILAQLQQHLDAISSAMQQTEDRKVLLRTQLTTLESVQAGTLESMGQDGSGAGQMPLSLEQARLQLQSLRSRYSDKHPDVLRVTATIAKLENEQGAAVPDANTEVTDVIPAPTQSHGLMQAQWQDLLAQLTLIDKQLANLAEEKNKVSAQIQAYQQRIENGPRIEQMFVDLRRGYEEANETYQSLLQKKLQAELAENLERTQKGEQFVILEPANLPQKPFKPNVWRLLYLGLTLALASSFGLAFLREYLDPTFWRSKDLENIAQVPVIVSIPVVDTNKERRTMLLKKVGATGAVASMASVLLYALFVLWKMDPTAFPWSNLR